MVVTLGKEQKHPITKAVLAPMKTVKKMLVSMELHLDASIDKLDNLAMNVQLDKEKHMENAKTKEQTEPERAEAERVEAEIVYAPMVATVYKGNIIKNLIMDCQSYTKYRPNETTGGIFVSWRRKEELPTGA